MASDDEIAWWATATHTRSQHGLALGDHMTGAAAGRGCVAAASDASEQSAVWNTTGHRANNAPDVLVSQLALRESHADNASRLIEA